MQRKHRFLFECQKSISNNNVQINEYVIKIYVSIVKTKSFLRLTISLLQCGPKKNLYNIYFSTIQYKI